MNAALLLAVLSAAPVLSVGIEKEEFTVLGWNDACSVAVSQLVYPKLGEAIHGEPIASRAGTLTIEPGSEAVATKWFREASGTNTWNPAAHEKVTRELGKLGYVRKGYAETVRTRVSEAQPGLAETLLSTRTLAIRPGMTWPTSSWRWSGADYSPLGTCALLLFESLSTPTRYAWRLTRIYNPRVRLERSRAHAANARLLFSEGELEGAVAEAGTAASLAPESALNRYVYATLLAMSGRPDESVAELRAAVERDPKRAKEARDDRDFESLRSRRDFRDLVGSSYFDRLTR